MLNSIYLSQVATIDKSQLQFPRGSIMVTGETGAGKSIFIEAIELALGERASPSIIRQGQDKADISLCFDLSSRPDCKLFLKNVDILEEGHECIIRRIIAKDARSRCYINHIPVTLQLLKSLGENLLHLHSQAEQQTLFKGETQRDMLDSFAGLLPLREEVKKAAHAWQEAHLQHEKLKLNREKDLEAQQALSLQLEELKLLTVREGEWEMLEQEHKRLAHQEELTRTLHAIMAQIVEKEEHAILSSLHQIQKWIESLHPYEPQAICWGSNMDSIAIQLNDLVIELKHYIEKSELSPEKLQQIEERLSQLFTFARKYKLSPADLPALQKKVIQQLDGLALNENTLLHFQDNLNALAHTYSEVASQLSEERKKAALKLSHLVTATIRSLSLPHGEFLIHFEKETKSFSPHGQETTTFLIKTHPDQNPLPLVKIISGGELSRLSLALHLAIANKKSASTLIFDEVDTGLSGAAAEKVGRLIRKLGETNQVFCVTHQAQVAALGQYHILVEKQMREGHTYTHLRLLKSDEKKQEIARLLGGEKITSTTLLHAEELLSSA